MQTITELMEISGAQYRIFDLGRAVRKIDKDIFAKFEDASLPYPYPMQGHAWFALLFWSPQSKQEHQIWFIRFPLDEQGLLKQACRDDFLKLTLQEVAQQQAQDDGPAEPVENPWGFTPRQDKMASVHAKSSVAMELPPSQFYEPVREFILYQQSDWQSLGVQGIADFCARLDEADNEAVLMAALPTLSDEFLAQVLPQLENEIVSQALGEAIARRCQDLGNPQLISAAIRALSQSRGDTLEQYVSDALNSPHQNNVEVLVAISGRAWDVLFNPAIALQFLEALARNDAGQEGFNHVLKDALQLPHIGPVIREAFRSPERSPALINALGEFLKNVH